MDARLVKITTSEPQKSFGIYYSILAEAQAMRARPAAATLNINVRLTGDDENEGRAECLVTFYADQPLSFEDLPASAQNCATIPPLFQRDATTYIRSDVRSDLGLPDLSRP